MKKSLLTVLALGGAVMLSQSSASPAFAQDAPAQAAPAGSAGSVDQDIDMLRKDIRSQKKQIIAANITLTDAEAQKFWPVYDQYTAALVQVNNDKYALIKEYADSYGTMTDAQADDWTKRMLQLDANVAAVRLKFQPAFRKVLSAKKTALYEQVERKTQMLIDVQLALQIPLVQP
jgi:Spy/CpxP family protein refolding chaperone